MAIPNVKLMEKSFSENKWYYCDGRVYDHRSWNGTYVSYQSANHYKTNNPVRLIDGVLPWRDPSVYEWGIIEERLKTGYAYIPATSPNCRGANGVARYHRGEVLTEYPAGPVFPRTFPSSPLDSLGKWDQNLVNHAQANAFEKMLNEQAQLGAALAEAKKTYDALAETAESMWRGLNALRRADSPRKIARAFGLDIPTKMLPGSLSGRGANNFLAWKFGWLPLYQDAYGLHNLLREQSLAKPCLMTSDGRKSETESVNRAYSNCSGSAKRTARVKIVSKIKQSYLRDATRLGLTNPASVAWELVPWSFLIDWGIPIASTLSQFTASAGLDFVGGFSSCSNNAEYDYRVSWGHPYVTTSPFGTNVKMRWYRRVPLGEFPRPAFYAKSPFSSSHAATALALWRQLM